MKIRQFHTYLALFIAFFPLFSHASYELLEKKLGFKTLKAKFAQTILSPEKRVISETRGSLLAKDDKLVWKTTQPFKQDVFVHGDIVELVDYDFETVQVNRITNQMGQLPLLMLTGKLQKARPHYKISVIKENAFRLEPLGELKETFEKAEIYFSGDLPHKMVIFDSFSQMTRIDFLSAKLNVGLSDKDLLASYPSNFDKIE